MGHLKTEWLIGIEPIAAPMSLIAAAYNTKPKQQTAEVEQVPLEFVCSPSCELLFPLTHCFYCKDEISQ